MAAEDLSKLKIDKSQGVVRPKRGRKIFRWAALALIIVLVVFLYFKGVFTPAVEVEITSVSQVYPAQSFTLLSASGYVVAQRKAAVASKITGRLVALTVEEGNNVKKGEVIARLESEDVTALKEQAEANLKAARFRLEKAKAELHDAALSAARNKELLKKGFIAQTEYDAASARYDKAAADVSASEADIRANAAALKNAGVSLEYTLIRAPFDAVVLTKNADIGDIVTPLGAAANAKASVVTIADMGSLQAEVDVSESNLGQVKVGQPCEIELDALPGSRFRGEVHMVVPTADRSKATVLVKVRFVDKDGRILPEMSVRVAFLERPVGPGEQKPRTALSSSAVAVRGGKKTAFLIQRDRVTETPVETGEKFGEMLEILSGVKTGDKVVLKPSEKLRNGARIKVVEK